MNSKKFWHGDAEDTELREEKIAREIRREIEESSTLCCESTKKTKIIYKSNKRGAQRYKQATKIFTYRLPSGWHKKDTHSDKQCVSFL